MNAGPAASDGHRVTLILKQAQSKLCFVGAVMKPEFAVSAAFSVLRPLRDN